MKSAIPELGSLILTHDWNGVVPGLNEWPASGPAQCDDRLLVVPHHGRPRLADGWRSACGAVGDAGARRSMTARAFTAPRSLMGPMGFVAVIAGWITTEVGRQPYTIYGLLRTAEFAARRSRRRRSRASLVAFVVVYFAVFGAGVFYILRLMAQPPRLHEPDIPSEAPICGGRHHARAGARIESAKLPNGGAAMTIDLAFIWAGLIAFAVLAYVVLDGFDLGIGILFPFFKREAIATR